MNSNIDIFRKTAAREIDPEAGATIILNRRRLQRQAAKPAWMPGWAFAGCVFLAVMFMSALTGRSNSKA